ncbi:hypothetical protein ISCGN_019339 [Ixodes scapularis]
MKRFGIGWDDSRSTEKPCKVTDGHIMSKNGEPTESASFSSCSYKTWEIEYFLQLPQEARNASIALLKPLVLKTPSFRQISTMVLTTAKYYYLFTKTPGNAR